MPEREIDIFELGKARAVWDNLTERNRNLLLTVILNGYWPYLMKDEADQHGNCSKKMEDGSWFKYRQVYYPDPEYDDLMTMGLLQPGRYPGNWANNAAPPAHVATQFGAVVGRIGNALRIVALSEKYAS